MSKSVRLHLSDVRNLYRLVGECRDRGDDPEIWRQHALHEVLDLVEAEAGIAGALNWSGSGAPEPVQMVDVGLAGLERVRYRRYREAGGWATDSMFRRFLERFKDPASTRTRPEVIDDREWYAARHCFTEYITGRRAAHLVSLCRLNRVASDRIGVIILHRRDSESDFDARCIRLVHWLHQELGQLVGGPLAAAGEPGIATLAPRLRQTLDRLLAGDSEKEVAASLGLSQLTVHQYIQSLYRHFQVGSRGQLLARWVRFSRQLDSPNTGSERDGQPDANVFEPTRQS